MSSILNYDKIKGLVYTEKTNKQLADHNKYTFEIDPSCTKKEVASLIKKIFKVDVVKVNIVNIKSENTKFRGIAGKTKARKKAVITLKEGNAIDFN